jgi:hypothetical protein
MRWVEVVGLRIGDRIHPAISPFSHIGAHLGLWNRAANITA